MKPNLVFEHFGLDAEVQEAITTVQALLRAKKAAIGSIDEQIRAARQNVVQGIYDKLAKAVEPLGSDWPVMLENRRLSACIDAAIDWGSDRIDFTQHLSFCISPMQVASLGVTPDELIEKVNKCWECGEEPPLARFGKSWENENQLKGEDTISIYFTLTYVFNGVGSDR